MDNVQESLAKAELFAKGSWNYYQSFYRGRAVKKFVLI